MTRTAIKTQNSNLEYLMSTEFTKWYYDTCIHMSNMKMLKLIQQFYRKSWKCSSFDRLKQCTRIASPYFGIRNGAWFKFYLIFFLLQKNIQHLSWKKKILYMRLKIEIYYSGPECENWTHIFVDIYNEEWFEKKISYNSKTRYLQGLTPVLYRSAGFKA